MAWQLIQDEKNFGKNKIKASQRGTSVFRCPLYHNKEYSNINMEIYFRSYRTLIIFADRNIPVWA